MIIFTYILRCADGSYYVGTARGDLDRRIAEHNAGTYRGYTSRRRPVELVWAQEYEDPYDAIGAERRIKGWSRAKKEALIAGDYKSLKTLSKRPGARRNQTDRGKSQASE
jgi:putative endonuclease